MDMMKMMKKAADLKKNLKKKQNELSKKTVEFTENGVFVKCSCDLKIISIKIDEELIKSCNVANVEKFVLKATQEALDLAQKSISKEMGSLTSGMNLPF